VIMVRVLVAPVLIGLLALLAFQHGVTGVRLALGTAVIGTLIYTVVDLMTSAPARRSPAWLRWTITSNLITSSLVGAVYAMLFGITP